MSFSKTKSLCVLALAAMVIVLPTSAFADLCGTTVGSLNYNYLPSSGPTYDVTIGCSAGTLTVTLANINLNGFSNLDIKAFAWDGTGSDPADDNKNGDGFGNFDWSFNFTQSGAQLTQTLSGLSVTPTVDAFAIHVSFSNQYGNCSGWGSTRVYPGTNGSSSTPLGEGCAPTTTPEPASLALLGVGLLGLGGMIRRRKQ